jgi:hypothetical protein
MRHPYLGGLKNHSISLLTILMSFYCPFAVVSIIETCRPGQWRQHAELQCVPCPVGMRCISEQPEPCPSETASVAPGSIQCCPRNTKCPSGTALDSSLIGGCECVPIVCPTPSMALVRLGKELHCTENVAMNGKPCQTGVCPSGYALETGCVCVKTFDCGRDGSWWRATQQRFVCLFSP